MLLHIQLEKTNGKQKKQDKILYTDTEKGEATNSDSQIRKSHNTISTTGNTATLFCHIRFTYFPHCLEKDVCSFPFK